MGDKNTVIPFGKYRGQEVTSIMARDPQYVQWLIQQAWFSEKFSPIYQLVVNNFAPPSEETPEHNALQVRFLDFDFRSAFWDVCGTKFDWPLITKYYKRDFPDKPCAPLTTLFDPKFEDIADVWFVVVATIEPDAKPYSDGHERHQEHFNLAIEIKPSMGDDYPAVLRQIKRQKIAAKETGGWSSWNFEHHLRWFLLVDHFSSNVVTLDQVRQIFKQDGINIVLMSDVRERVLKNQQDKVQ